MRQLGGLLAALGLTALLTLPASADVIYNNLTPNNLIGIATRPDSAGLFEIEAADDFVLPSPTSITSASFVGILVPGAGGAPSISGIVAEMYRVFPLDSDAGRTPNVPTRANSPSDIAFDERDGASGLTFSSTILDPAFAVLNSVQPGGIHASPLQHTGGDGPLTGIEVQIDLTFNTPFNLPADHFFFVPQVSVSNGGTFYWLSASRPIAGAGTTPFPPGVTDLQAWTRDEFLDPDWLRVGTDIVGGSPAPLFNTAFSLDGNVAPAVPEPSTLLMLLPALALLRFGRRRVVKG
jgi:hypothetical protein